MRKITVMGVALVALFLGSCATHPNLIEQKHVVFVPDQTKFECKKLAALPKPDNLTDADVAQLIAELYTYNSQCYMTNQSLFNTLKAASVEIGSGGTINGKFVRTFVSAHIQRK